MSELVKNAISKNLVIFKVFLEKMLELFLRYWIFGFKAKFLLILLLNYYFAEKQYSKKDMI